ncbi:MAG: ribonuclease Z [Planctomycetota bacterium]
MQVTILGTSSAIPTFKRGLSATFLDRGAQSFLFDCGEGTQFQIMRAGLRRGRLAAIFITHLHGDHCYGLPGFLSSLGLNNREAKLDIYGPEGVKRLVDFFLSFPRKMRLSYEIEVHEIPPGFEGEILDHKEYRVRTLPLFHRVPTQGYRFEEKPRPGVFDEEKAEALGIPFGPERGQLIRGEALTLADGTRIEASAVVGPSRPGKSFVYCTDTGFCINAKRLAEGCDLLLHEATYGDELTELARERRHATIRQAAAVARAAGAKKFVATHFSTRYDRHGIAKLEEEGRELFPDIIMAKDLMCLDV